MKIYVGADHNGFHMREALVKYLQKAGYEVVDAGGSQLNPADDFPVFAVRVITDMLASDNPDPRGILLCGSGQGMCIAANRFKGIRAALLYDRESARSSRNDDDTNIACIPAKVLEKDEAYHIIETWLSTPFSKTPRYVRRIRALDELN